MEVTKIVLACIILVVVFSLMFLDPHRIGKDRKPFTASDYACNLIIYIAMGILCVLVLVEAVQP